MTDIHINSNLVSRMSNPNSGSHLNPAMKRSADDDDDSSNDKDATTQQKKIVFGLNKKEKNLGSPQKKKVMSSISIKLGGPMKTANSSAPTLKPKVGSAALAFNEDEDDDEEEMPPEAKMRMKNIGRDTPTSSGPNSFGKSRMGFCDSKKMYERKLREIQDQLEDD